MTKFVPGKYRAAQTGYLFDRLWPEGKTVVVSQEYLEEHELKHGAPFSAQWLELISAYEVVEEDGQVVREKKEAFYRDQLEALGVDVDGRWGLSKLQEQLEIAKGDKPPATV